MAVSWDKVLQLLVVNRLIDPGSEFRVRRLLAHKQDLFVWLKQKWADLFHADFEVLLYDLTSTYFEDAMERNPKAKRGYSRDGRPDCLRC